MADHKGHHAAVREKLAVHEAEHDSDGDALVGYLLVTFTADGFMCSCEVEPGYPAPTELAKAAIARLYPPEDAARADDSDTIGRCAGSA